MKYFNTLQNISVIAGEDLKEGDLVKIDSTGAIKVPTNDDGKKILGVVIKGGSAGQEVTVGFGKLQWLKIKSDTTLNPGDEFGLDNGEATVVDGSNITNAVGVVIKVEEGEALVKFY